MPDRTPPRILLEGRPGVGKTTVARRLVAALKTAGVPVTGFTTEEMREGGRRIGFAIESVPGARETLAHIDLPGPPRVGRYGVDLAAFERIALPSLGPPGDVVVIDELGKMELSSSAFREAVAALLEREVPLVATVHLHRDLFTDRLKRRPDVDVVRVTERTRDELTDRLFVRLLAWRGKLDVR